MPQRPALIGFPASSHPMVLRRLSHCGCSFDSREDCYTDTSYFRTSSGRWSWVKDTLENDGQCFYILRMHFAVSGSAPFITIYSLDIRFVQHGYCVKFR